MTGNALANTMCVPSVLVVDNSEPVRHIRAETLRRWGYEPVVAVGQGLALLNDAIDKARRNHCLIAVVDMRLLDEHDPNDYSGLELVQNLKPTASIIVTNHANIQALRMAWKGEAEDFVTGEEIGDLPPASAVESLVPRSAGPQLLREAIDQARSRYCFCGIQITGMSEEEIVAKLKLKRYNATAGEVKCVLARLYRSDDEPAVRQLQLKLPDAPYASYPSAAVAVRSAVFEAEAIRTSGARPQREIIKLAPRAQIEREVSNYRDYVKNNLSFERTARIEDRKYSVLLWNIGGIRYTNVAIADRMQFKYWYAGAAAADISRALTDLFRNTLGPWYASRGPFDSGQVFDYYVRNVFSRFDERMQSFHTKDEFLTLPGLSRQLTNPVRWAMAHRGQSAFTSQWQAITHGDLHSDNIFVDESARTYVIDYEKSGPGYVLRDFAELEVAIKLQLLALQPEQISLVYRFEHMLLAHHLPHRVPEWQSPVGTSSDVVARMSKSFEAICTLRKLASDIVGFERLDEYYWAVLMETLISVVRDYSSVGNRELAEWARNRALVSAALICERLAKWREPWTPLDPLDT